MISETLTPETDPCTLAAKWRLERDLALGVVFMGNLFPFDLQIISGYRSPEQQQELIDDGVGAPLHLSNHVTCPSRAADLWPLVHPANQIKIEFGRVAQLAGLRWGGGSPADPTTGIPSDWNHVDLGPRQQ